MYGYLTIFSDACCTGPTTPSHIIQERPNSLHCGHHTVVLCAHLFYMLGECTGVGNGGSMEATKDIGALNDASDSLGMTTSLPTLLATFVRPSITAFKSLDPRELSLITSG